MDASIGNVEICNINESGQPVESSLKIVSLQFLCGEDGITLSLRNGHEVLFKLPLNKQAHYIKAGDKCLLIKCSPNTFRMSFNTSSELAKLLSMLDGGDKNKNAFTERTEESSASQYFQFYGYLSQQQNMMQDYIRTSTFQQAMLKNSADFRDKIVIDVGAGSGILSFFAIQAGAKRVYAIEASSMAQHCQVLVDNNKLTGKIIVVPGIVEEVTIPEKCDIIISEPMGYMLFNERMLESYLHAKKWLKEGGKMFPTVGDLHISPFTDDALYMEQFSKTNFWYQQSFHGVDLSSLRQTAIYEYFRQPIVDTFDCRILMASSVKHTVDFEKAVENDLQNIDIPIHYTAHSTGTIHGLAFWFDVAFRGSKQSYAIEIQVSVKETGITSTNCLDLKNPFFRYTGQMPAPPPGSHTQSPTDSYWNQVASQLSSQTQLVNGVLPSQSHNINCLGAMSQQQLTQPPHIAYMGSPSSQDSFIPYQ